MHDRIKREHRLEGALSEIGAICWRRLSTAKAVRDQHGRDESHHPAAPPDAVVFAHSTDEVARIAQICSRNQIPVIAFGAGTSLEGQIAAVDGGVWIDLSQMSAIIEINCGDLDATAQAGVTRQQLNAHMRETGLFFAVDPGSEATLRGMAAYPRLGFEARLKIFGVTDRKRRDRPPEAGQQMRGRVRSVECISSAAGMISGITAQKQSLARDATIAVRVSDGTTTACRG
jgi:FAD/FMN-containing dehydrogenase